MRLQSPEGLTEAGGFIAKMPHLVGKLLLAVFQRASGPLCMDLSKDSLEQASQECMMQVATFFKT